MPTDTSHSGLTFAGWVEMREDICRGDRRLYTVVNRRNGRALHLSEDEKRACQHGRVPADLLDALNDGGFLHTDRPGDPADVAHGTRMGLSASLRKADVQWAGADRPIRFIYDRIGRHAFRPF